MIYLELFLVAVVTVYIVDISGFTDSWRAALAHLLRVKALKPLPPFDCGKCMTWWACLVYAICVHRFTLGVVAFSAVLSLCSIPIGQVLIFIRESLAWLIGKVTPRW